MDPVELVRELMPLNPRGRVRIRQGGLEEPVMPYGQNEDLPDAVKKLPGAKQSKWRAVFNGAYETYKDDPDRDGRAAATAWAAVKNDDTAASDRLGALMQQYELQQGVRRLLCFPRGTFKHPEYGTMAFDDAFFDEIIANFEGKALGNTEPFIDIDHDHGAACGWLKSLSKEDQGLYATVAWTPLGESKIAANEYRFFSPWWGAYEDPSTGQKYKRVLRGGALTNVPFLKVLPPIELYEPGVKSRARSRAWGEGRTFQLSEIVLDESLEDQAQRIRNAWNAQYGSAGGPVTPMPVTTSGGQWVKDVLEDAVVVCDGQSDSLVPYEDDDGEVTFYPDEQEPVTRQWVPTGDGDYEDDMDYAEPRDLLAILNEHRAEQIAEVFELRGPPDQPRDQGRFGTTGGSGARPSSGRAPAPGAVVGDTAGRLAKAAGPSHAGRSGVGGPPAAGLDTGLQQVARLWARVPSTGVGNAGNPWDGVRAVAAGKPMPRLKGALATTPGPEADAYRAAVVKVAALVKAEVAKGTDIETVLGTSLARSHPSANVPPGASAAPSPTLGRNLGIVAKLWARVPTTGVGVAGNPWDDVRAVVAGKPMPRRQGELRIQAGPAVEAYRSAVKNTAALVKAEMARSGADVEAVLQAGLKK